MPDVDEQLRGLTQHPDRPPRAVDEVRRAATRHRRARRTARGAGACVAIVVLATGAVAVAAHERDRERRPTVRAGPGPSSTLSPSTTAPNPAEGSLRWRTAAVTGSGPSLCGSSSANRFRRAGDLL